MLCRTRTLNAEKRRGERREEALLQMIRELQDRLMLMADRPWTLPPRPMDDPVDEHELAEQVERAFYEPV